MDELYLVQPSKQHEMAAMDYRREYIGYGETNINGSNGFMRYGDFERWLADVTAHETSPPPGEVRASTYFSVRKSDGKIIGTIQLRHELDDYLRKRGGHIGYGIRPSERRKGYGAAQLSLVLDKAKELGIPRVMISCDQTNKASARVAIKCGAKLEWQGYDDEDGHISIYWIDLE